MDHNGDGVISLEEFMDTCRNVSLNILNFERFKRQPFFGQVKTFSYANGNNIAFVFILVTFPLFILQDEAICQSIAMFDTVF